MTCSMYEEENEELIINFLKNNNNYIIKDLSGFVDTIKKDETLELYDYKNTKYNEYKNKIIKILPNEYYEGFFFCILEMNR